LDDAPKQTVSVVAKDTEIYFPAQIWPLAAIYLIDKMPPKSGESTSPFVARVVISWETADGEKQRDFRIRITATNTKASDSGSPLVDSILNFSIEELN
jgi:hypothetical protein